MTTQMIAWNTLVPSPRNVRRVKSDVAGLAASIAADGLLQNLVVALREDGKFEVLAGERRRRAIGQLVKAKSWAKDQLIPCEVRERDEATALSLAENTQRVAMHPSDAFRAFAALAAEGHDETAIANRYGYDPREVRRLLALGGLRPKVLGALAADKIDVATAQAFTLTDDHARQEAVLRKARSAYEVRRLLTETKVTTSHRLFRFVGAQAYEAAGGGYTCDLFATEGEAYANDGELVAELAQARFDRLATEARAEGWADVIADEREPHQAYSWHRLHPREPRPLTEAEAMEVAEIEAILAGSDPEDEGVPGARSRLETIARQAVTWTAADMAKAVLVIVPGAEGQPVLSAYTKQVRRSVEAGHGGNQGGERPLYDQRMMTELSQVRTAALQHEIARDPALARDVLLDALLGIVLAQGHVAGHAVQLTRAGTLQSANVFDINAIEIPSPFDGIADLQAAMPGDAEQRFAWLRGLEDDDKARLLAVATAALLDATAGKFADRARLGSADRIARAVKLDMTGHFEGGVEFYARLTRRAMLAALSEAISPQAAENFAKLPKAALAVACADRIPGRGWLPPALRTPEPEAVRAEDRNDEPVEGQEAMAYAAE
jgi:ParB family chromosome partitioning protein